MWLRKQSIDYTTKISVYILKNYVNTDNLNNINWLFTFYLCLVIKQTFEIFDSSKVFKAYIQREDYVRKYAFTQHFPMRTENALTKKYKKKSNLLYISIWKKNWFHMFASKIYIAYSRLCRHLQFFFIIIRSCIFVKIFLSKRKKIYISVMYDNIL